MKIKKNGHIVLSRKDVRINNFILRMKGDDIMIETVSGNFRLQLSTTSSLLAATLEDFIHEKDKEKPADLLCCYLYTMCTSSADLDSIESIFTMQEACTQRLARVVKKGKVTYYKDAEHLLDNVILTLRALNVDTEDDELTADITAALERHFERRKDYYIVPAQEEDMDKMREETEFLYDED